MMVSSKILTCLMVVALLASSSVSAASSSSSSSSLLRTRRQLLLEEGGAGVEGTPGNVPFYATQDQQGQLVVVVQYGTSDEPEKKIRVPCRREEEETPSSTGPGVVVCQQVADNDYKLLVPFRFERDADGNIVSVVHDGTMQTISFSTTVDADGTLTGVSITNDSPPKVPFYTRNDPETGAVVDVVYDDGQDQQTDKTDCLFSPRGAMLIAGLVVAGLVLVGCAMHFCWAGVACSCSKKAPKNDNSEEVSPNKTTADEEDTVVDVSLDDE